MRIFKRIIRIVVGQEDGTALAIEKLFMEIEVKKFLSGKPNEGFGRIYNLSETSENQIREKGIRIRIFAGYDGQPVLLHDGDIRRVDRDGFGKLNRITTINIGGNVAKLSSAFFNKSYSGQVAVKQIVADAVPSFGIDAINIDQIPDNAFLYDYSFTGKTGDLLDEILNPIDVQWFENDNFINFSLKGSALESVVVLSKNTGLIGSPSVTEKGIKFKSALNGRITVTNRVKIESQAATGVYKVGDIAHTGDNRAGKFETNGIGLEIG
ncbi:MAG: hypothetical protein KAR40_13900 [Candidatus Sabulitectum sp.]|nr:hypothetical protein [Candidatus Sabulitectum sp.]